VSELVGGGEAIPPGPSLLALDILSSLFYLRFAFKNGDLFAVLSIVCPTFWL